MSQQSQPLKKKYVKVKTKYSSMIPRNSNEKAFLLGCPQAVRLSNNYFTDKQVKTQAFN